MNKENAKDFLPLVQALADGKTIQIVDPFGVWVDITCTEFAAPVNKYRIKPEPREWTIIFGNNGKPYLAEDCRKDVQGQSIRVREILD